MPDFIFTDPNGVKHTVTGPAGATPEQAFKILQAQLPNQPRTGPPPSAAEPPASQPPDLLDKLGARVGNAAAALAGTDARGTGGADLSLASLRKTSPLIEAGARGIGAAEQIGGAVADIATPAVNFIAKGVKKEFAGDANALLSLAPPEMQAKIKALPGEAIEAFLKTDTGKKAVELARKGADWVSAFSKDNPQVAGLIKEAPNLALAEAGVTGISALASPLKDVANGLFRASVPALEDASTALWAKANGTIENAKNAGLSLHPGVEHDIKGGVANIKQLSTAGDRANAPKTDALVKDFISSISPKEVKDAPAEPGDTTLRNILGYRKALDTIANGKLGDDSIAARKVSEHIDEVISKHLKEGKISGKDVSAAQDLPLFKKQWTDYKNHQTLTKVLADNQGNYKAMQKALMKVRDGKYFSTFPAEAQQFIKEGAAGKMTGGVLNALGSGIRLLGNKKMWAADVAGGGLAALHPSVLVPAAGFAGASALANAGGKSVMKGSIQDALAAISRASEGRVKPSELGPPPRSAPPTAGLPRSPVPAAPAVSPPPAPEGKYIDKADVAKSMLAQTHKDAMDYVIEQGKKTGNEHAVLVDNNTGKIIHKVTSGRRGAVSFNDAQGRDLADPRKKISLHHNHPDPVPLSDADVGILGFPGAEEVVAHTHAGESSAARLTPEAVEFLSRSSADPVKKALFIRGMYNDIASVISKELGPLVLGGKIDVLDAEFLIQDGALRALHHAGLIEYSSSMRTVPSTRVDKLVYLLADKTKKALKTKGFSHEKEINNPAAYPPARSKNIGNRPRNSETPGSSAGTLEANRVFNKTGPGILPGESDGGIIDFLSRSGK